MSTMTSADIHKALRTRHPKGQWVYVAELRTRTGFNDFGSWSTFDQVRSIDAFAMGCWKSNDYRRVAYEIKVSRGDWKRELEDPRKRAQAYFLSNQFYFAVAPGVVHMSDGYRQLDGCGLLEIQEDGSIKELRRASLREAWPMPLAFTASLLRHAAGVYESEREHEGIATVATPNAPILIAGQLFEEATA